MRTVALLVGIAAAAAGCKYSPTFNCEDSSQCSAGGRCEPDGLCSVPDATCPSGYRYEDYSGELSGVCVGDAPGIVHVGFQFPSSLTDESVGTHAISVALDAPSTTAVTVDVEVTGGTAERDVDYTLATATVTVPAGATVAEVDLSIIADAVEESDETIELTLVRPTGAVLDHDTHTVTISANVLPRVQFSSTSSMAPEGMGSTRTVPIELDVAGSVDVVVSYAVAGTATTADHDLVPGMLTIPAGQTMAMLTFDLVQDTLDEFDETVDITLSAQVGAVVGVNASHVHTILDDDAPPTLGFGQASSNKGEATGAVGLDVALSAPSGKDIGFSITTSGTATAGTDYTAPGSPITIPAGQVSASVPVMLLDDTTDEDDETAVLNLTNPMNVTLGATVSHTLTIVDDDQPPIVRFDPAESDGAALEGNGTGSTDYLYHVVLSASSGRTVSVTLTVSGSANGQDGSVMPLPTLTFPPGTSSVTVTVRVNRDNSIEPDNTFVMNLQNPVNAVVGAPSTRVHTILDDD